MPAKIQLSKEQINEMLRLKTKEKMSYEAIGKIFGVSAQTVSRQLKLLDIDPVALIAVSENSPILLGGG